MFKMNKKTPLFISLFLISCIIGCDKDSNPSDSTLTLSTNQKIIDLGQDEYGIEVIQLSNGDFILAGNVQSGLTMQYSVLVMKLDRDWNEIWSNIYGHDIYLRCYNLVETVDGYVFGGSRDGNQQLFITKIDNSGNEVWNYISDSNMGLWSNTVLLKTINNNFLIANGYGLTSTQEYGIRLQKIDASGIFLHEITIELENEIFNLSVCQSSDENYILNYESGSGNPRTIIHKIDPLGQTIWRLNYQMEQSWTNGYSLCAESGGGCILSGSVDSFMYLLKINGEGSIQWIKKYEFDAAAWDIKETADGGFLITGTLDSNELFLMKTGSDGNILWQTKFSHYERNWGSCVIETLEGGSVAIGTTEDRPFGPYDIFLVKAFQN